MSENNGEALEYINEMVRSRGYVMPYHKLMANADFEVLKPRTAWCRRPTRASASSTRPLRSRSLRSTSPTSSHHLPLLAGSLADRGSRTSLAPQLVCEWECSTTTMPVRSWRSRWLSTIQASWVNTSQG